MLEDVPLPVPRLAECPGCHAELHVCRLCTYYDTGVADSCREPVAEPVHDKERANFCGYFQPCADAYRPRDAAAEHQARDELAALFGEPSNSGPRAVDAEDSTAEARARLDALFGPEDDSEV